MKEYIPSTDFVENTMAAIKSFEEKKYRLFSQSLIREAVWCAGVAGAFLVGIANLLRLVVTIYAPVICH